jgi:hypothetical protein
MIQMTMTSPNQSATNGLSAIRSSVAGVRGPIVVSTAAADASLTYIDRQASSRRL